MRDNLLVLGPVVLVVARAIPEDRYPRARLAALAAGGLATAYGVWLRYRKEAAAWAS